MAEKSRKFYMYMYDLITLYLTKKLYNFDHFYFYLNSIYYSSKKIGLNICNWTQNPTKYKLINIQTDSIEQLLETK